MSDRYRVYIESKRAVIEDHDLVLVKLGDTTGFMSRVLYDMLANKEADFQDLLQTLGLSLQEISAEGEE